MELREYWTILRRRWWIPLVLAALVGIFSAIQLQPWQPQPVSYAASLRMIIGVMPAGDAADTAYDPRYYAWLTSEYLVDDFTEVVRSGLFAQNVSQRLAQQSITVPAGMIQGSAATGEQHRIITLSFSWPDQDQLAAIVDAVTEVVTVDASSIAPAPALVRGLSGAYLLGMVTHKAQVMLVLDIARVLTASEALTLQELQSEQPVPPND